MNVKIMLQFLSMLCIVNSSYIGASEHQRVNDRTFLDNLSEIMRHDLAFDALISAIQHRPAHVALVREIISKNPNVVNFSTKHKIGGFTALMVAVSKYNKEIVKILIDAGADLNLRDNNGYTALNHVKGYEEDMAALLLKNGANPNLKDYRRGRTPLMTVAGNKERAALLLENGANPNLIDADFYTALMYVAQNGTKEVAEMLLRAGADPYMSCGNITASSIARGLGRIDIAETIENYKRQYQGGGQYVANDLANAINSSNVALVRKIISEKPDAINFNIHVLHQDKAATALMLAAEKGSEEIVRMLLDAGADPNLQNKKCETALMLAIPKRHKDIVAILLDKGADPNLESEGKYTALTYAIQAANWSSLEFKEIIAMLLAKGANPNLQNDYGKTPLMYAVLRHAKEVVEMLLNAGADINLQDDEFQTALMYAVLENSKEMVEILLNAGADFEMININAISAFTLAKEKGFVGIEKILEESRRNSLRKNNSAKESEIAAPVVVE